MVRLVLLVVVSLVLFVGIYGQFPVNLQIRNALLPQGFVAWQWAQGLNNPRQIIRLPNSNDLVVLETKPNSQISLLFDDNNDGVNDASERIVLVNGNSTALPAPTNLGLNHAVLYHNGYIYASSDTTVYRWPYTVGSRAPIQAAGQVMITGITPGGRHSTRTLNFDSSNRLYVQMGSMTDIDSVIDSGSRRARIHRFDAGYFDGTIPLSAPLDYFLNGTVYGAGLRNHVAYRFDSQDRCLGVENGIDVTVRTNLGGDISFNNPGEELNLLPDINSLTTSTPKFYGYPACWSEFALNITSGPQIPHGPGTQWADTNWLNDGVHTDAWCQNATNNVPPVTVFDPHSAALDIVYYYPNGTPSSGPAFGSSISDYSNVAFISQHGSSHRGNFNYTGYQVVAVKYSGNAQGTINVDSKSSFFRAQGPGNFPNNWWRPTAMTFAQCPGGGDCLFVTADVNNTVLALGYYPNRYIANTEIPLMAFDPCPVASPSPTPCVTPCPSCSPCPDDDESKTSINFYFADMLRKD